MEYEEQPSKSVGRGQVAEVHPPLEDLLKLVSVSANPGIVCSNWDCVLSKKSLIVYCCHEEISHEALTMSNIKRRSLAELGDRQLMNTE